MDKSSANFQTKDLKKQTELLFFNLTLLIVTNRSIFSNFLIASVGFGCYYFASWQNNKSVPKRLVVDEFVANDNLNL